MLILNLWKMTRSNHVGVKFTFYTTYNIIIYNRYKSKYFAIVDVLTFNILLNLT